MTDPLESVSNEPISSKSLRGEKVTRLANGVCVYDGSLRQGNVYHEVDELILTTEGIIDRLPETGIGYVIEVGYLMDAYVAFNMERLRGVAQLARLGDPDNKPLKTILAETFTHTRLNHSLDVCVLATIVGTNLKLSRAQMNALQLATLTHDIRTPAGGDTTKMIDPHFQ